MSVYFSHPNQVNGENWLRVATAGIGRPALPRPRLQQMPLYLRRHSPQKILHRHEVHFLGQLVIRDPVPTHPAHLGARDRTPQSRTSTRGSMTSTPAPKLYQKCAPRPAYQHAERPSRADTGPLVVGRIPHEHRIHQVNDLVPLAKVQMAPDETVRGPEERAVLERFPFNQAGVSRGGGRFAELEARELCVERALRLAVVQ